MSRLDQFQGQQVVSGKSDLPAPRLRVALLTNFIPPYLLPVLRGLSSKVADLHVFISTAMEADRFWAVDWTGLQVTVQKTMTTGVRRKHPIGYSVPGYLHFSYDTIPLLSRYKPNVVISSQLGPRTMQSFLYCKMSRDAHLITWADLSERSECGIGRMRSAVRRVLLQSSDAVLVNGSSGARYVERLGARAKTVFRVPFVREMDDFCSLPLTRDSAISRRLLYVGRLIEGKGIHLLLAALARRKHHHPQRPLECWIVGEGPLQYELNESARSNNLNVKFLGHVPFDELYRIYGSVGIFVLPTLDDTWGLVVNEALAAGLPVLGSQYSQAVEELVQDGVNGWRFRPDQPEGLDAALERALNTSEAALQQMRVAARSRVAHLTPEFAANRIFEAIAAASCC
jgi:glycosyltransferase involved in cell wall biosynthesis